MDERSGPGAPSQVIPRRVQQPAEAPAVEHGASRRAPLNGSGAARTDVMVRAGAQTHVAPAPAAAPHHAGIGRATSASRARDNRLAVPSSSSSSWCRGSTPKPVPRAHITTCSVTFQDTNLHILEIHRGKYQKFVKNSTSSAEPFNKVVPNNDSAAPCWERRCSGRGWDAMGCLERQAWPKPAQYSHPWVASRRGHTGRSLPRLCTCSAGHRCGALRRWPW